MESRTRRRTASIVALAASAALAFSLAGCSSSNGAGTSLGSGSSGSQSTAGALKPFKVASVTSLDSMPYLYAQAQGYYKDAGLDVTFSSTDSGPAVVTGVLNGTYDAATAAAFPILIAISKGADLKVFPGDDLVAPGHGNSGLVVKNGSPVTGYKDLVGKKVATNALTSLTTLATKIGVKQAGGDPNAVNFTSLPFKSSVQAVAQGQAAAAVVIAPFQTEAVQNGMKDLLDPIGTMMPEGSPYSTLVTSSKNATAKASEFAAFNKATDRAINELKGNIELQRKLAVSEVGLPEAVAKLVPLPDYDAGPINVAAFQKYADLVHEFGYTDTAVDVAKVVVQP